MRITALRLSVCAAIVLGAGFFTVVQVAPQSPAVAPPAVDRFAPIAWMTGDWRALTSPQAGHKPITIEHRMHPILGGKALSFVTTFNGVEHDRGLFAYDPERKVIAFWNPSADGDLTIGTVSEQSGYILLDLSVTDSSGITASHHVQVRRLGADDYDWALYNHTASDSRQILSLHYHRIAN